MKKRVYQIDLFRFISALSVVLFHYTFGSSLQNTFPLLEPYSRYGYLGVSFFFQISGFVILFSTEHRNISLFLKSRFIRLYPVYWICLSLTTLVVFLFSPDSFNIGLKQFILNLTMIQAKLGASHIDFSYWTLWVEMKFYCLMLFFLILYRKVKLSSDVFIYSWLFISMLLTINILGETYFGLILRKVFIMSYSFYFISGMIFYKIYKNGFFLKHFVGLIICLFLSVYHEIAYCLVFSIDLGVSLSKEVIVIFNLVIYLLMFLVSTKRLEWMNKKIFLSLGVITYPLYLLHQKIGYIMFDYFSEVDKNALLVYLILGFMLVSYGVNKYIEKPITNVLKRSMIRDKNR